MNFLFGIVFHIHHLLNKIKPKSRIIMMAIWSTESPVPTEFKRNGIAALQKVLYTYIINFILSDLNKKVNSNRILNMIFKVISFCYGGISFTKPRSD